eukprot:gene491-530_t
MFLFALSLIALWAWSGVEAFQPRLVFSTPPLRTSPRFRPTTEHHLSTTTVDNVVEIVSEFRSSDPIRKLIVSEGFPKVNQNDTVYSAVKIMNAFDKGAILVFDNQDEITGIFTERDFVSKVIDNQLRSSDIIIGDVMTPKDKLVVGREDDQLQDCRKLMLQHNIRHLPILAKDGKDIVGIVSMRDIIKALQAEDIACCTARFSGDSLFQIQEQAREDANILALSSRKQDILRTGFVIAASVIGVGILQGEWIHQHQYLAMIATFVLGYMGIIFETFFELNKAGIALIMSTALWVIYATSSSAAGVATADSLHVLGEKVTEVSEIVFFILGAMTIVEIVDSHQGFKMVTDRIQAADKRALMWVIGLLTFFMSAILDNLTTTIVMVSLVKKLLPDDEDRKLFGAMVVIAANAGGAWTPIGDVTTTMLWINGQISALPTMFSLLIPSLASVIVSIFALLPNIPLNTALPPKASQEIQLAPRGQLVFTTGLLGLLSVPLFKAFTGLPPYLGMLASLGMMWSLTDVIHAGEDRESLMAPAALKKIDTSGVLFFLGILLSVGALDSAGILRGLAETLDSVIPDTSIVATLIGVASAIIDNVPLVAATMGMYDLNQVPMDSTLWQLIAYCAGTGGSMLVIGSAAGVALMGLEKVDFMWYVKKITLAAGAGYLTGIGVYLAQNQIVNGLFGGHGDAFDLPSTVSAITSHLPF